MPTVDKSRQARPVSFFSVVRYVPDPIRDEAKNIGVLVVSPESGFAGSRFNLSKLHLAPGSDRLRFLHGVVESYQRRLPAAHVDDRAVVRREFLHELHAEATNVVQFTEPSVALGDPRKVLEDVYRERVAERSGGTAPGLGRSDVFASIAKTFRKAGLPAEALVSMPWISVGQDHYVFDMAAKNGTWVGVVEVLSFKKQDTLRVEQEGAWFAKTYPLVRDAYGSEGRVIIEPSPLEGEGRRREARVRDWAMDAGALVHDPDELEAVGSALASRISATDRPARTE